MKSLQLRSQLDDETSWDQISSEILLSAAGTSPFAAGKEREEGNDDDH